MKSNKRKAKSERFKKFFGLSGRERMLFLEALFFQLCVGLLLKIIPFKWIPGLFSSVHSQARSRQSTSLQQIKAATQRASGVSPWKNKCLVSSIAARCMLKRRKIPSQLSLGVAKNREGMTIAHAWLRTGSYEIVEKSGDYSELFLF